MDNPYQIPLDRTGFGPSGTGNNPTMAERMMSQADKFHTSRVIDAMRFNDPYMQQVMAQQARILGATHSHDEVLRRAYGTPQGQIAQDVLMGARVSGFLGKGDPRMYAYNVTRGITSGGFGMDVLDGTNRQIGFGQRVQGNGVLAERLAMNYTRNLTSDLYGQGTPDARKLHGFNMQDASEIFAQVARDSGLSGRAMTVQRNANLATRLDAARDSAVNPLLRSGLAKIAQSDMEKLSSAESAFRKGDSSKLDAYLATIGDENLRREVGAITRGTDAFVVNDAARKQTADVVKEVIKGLSSLKDIYGELSNPALRIKMEELTGVRVTDITTSRRSAALVERIRGAAEANGYDPRAYMDMLTTRTAGLGGRIGGLLGLDERGGRAAEAAAGMFRANIGANAALAARMAVESEARGKALGFAMTGSAKDVSYYMADQEQGIADYVSKNKASMLLRGSLSLMDPTTRAQAMALSQARSAAKGPEEVAAAEARMRAFVAQNLGDGSFAQAEARYMNNALTQLGLNTLGMGDVTNADIAAGRQNAYLTANTRGKLTRAGIAGANVSSITATMTNALGSGGMIAIEEAIRNKNAGIGGKRQRIAQIMGEAGVSQADADIYMRNIYNDDLTASKVELGSIVNDLVAGGGGEQSTGFGRRRAARNYLNQSDGLRNTLGDDSGALSIKSVLNAIATGTAGELNSDAGKTLLLQTMKDAGMAIRDASGRDMSGMLVGNLDISKGVTADMLKSLRGITSGNLGGTDAEIMAATKTEEGRAAWLQRLRALEDINVSGNQNNLDVISKKLLDDANTSKAAQRWKEFGIAKNFLFPGMGADEENRFTQSFKAGGDLDIGLQADRLGEIGWWQSTKLGLGTADVLQMANAKKFNTINERILAANPEQLTEFGRSSAGRQTLKQLEQQLATIKEARAAGYDLMGMEDGTQEGFSDARVKAFEEAIAKLSASIEASAESVGNMKVEHLEVTGTYKPAQ